MNQDMGSLSDKQLESEIRRHSESLSLWNELFTRISPCLFLRAMYTCNNNTMDAEDLVQAVLLAACERLFYPSFGIELGFQRELNNRELSQDLRQEFETSGSPISDNATISVRKKGKRWVITDKGARKSSKIEYFIRKEEDRLNIYFMPESLYSYIHGIAGNISSQWIKQRQKDRASMIHPDKGSEEDEYIKELPSPGTDPLRSLLEEEDEGDIAIALGKISMYFDHRPNHWKIIRLAKIEKLPHEEIAVRMGIKNANTSRQQLYKAVNAMKIFLNKHNIGEEMACKAIMRYYYEMHKGK